MPSFHWDRKTVQIFLSLMILCLNVIVPKKVELLAKVYDHAKHAYRFGFRMLTLSIALHGWSMEKGTSVMLTLLEAAKKAVIPAKYVLFDSWFSSPSTLHAVKDDEIIATKLFMSATATNARSTFV